MELEIKKCERAFWEEIRNIRNASKDYFLNSSYINTETHELFMQQHCKNYFVAILDKTNVVGFAGVVHGDIRIGVQPNFQGLGIGKKLLERIKKEFPNSVAKILIDNQSSLSLFESCGFTKKLYVLYQ